MTGFRGNGPGAVLARRLLPFVLVVPVLLGWLRFAAQRWGAIDLDVGIALMVLATIVLLGGAVLWMTGALDRTAAAAEESEERFGATFEQAAVGIAHVALDGRFRRVNRRFCEIVGYTAQELTARSFADITSSAAVESDVASQHRLLAGEIASYRTEKRYVRKDGSLVWVALTSSVARDARLAPSYFISVIEEIEERKRSEERMLWLVAAVDQSPASVIIVDTAGRIQYVNRRFTEVTGYHAREAIGQSPRLLKSGTAQPETYRDLWDTIRGGGSWHGELQNRRKNGALYWDLVSIAPIRDAAGVVTHYIGTQEEITARKELEKQYRHAQKMEAVGRLAGGVAHDFNNLLTVITSYTSEVLEGLPVVDRRRADLEEVLVAAESAARLTRQLLAFSRQQVVEPRLVRVSDVVANAGKMLRRLIGEDVELDLVVHDDPVTVRIDPGQLEQVIVNLAVNARDAMPRGGKLTIESSSVELGDEYVTSHWSVAAGRFALLVVTDTGVGMDEATQARIFEPFFTTKEPGTGTGLGLSTVFGIVKQNGGHITVYSEPERGSTFKIYLPLEVESTERDAGTERPTEVARGTEVILLAEDDAAVRAAVRLILERLGYTVLDAPSGKVARNLAEQHRGPIQLLLTDVVMSEMSGRELAEALGAVRPEIRVLYMSGYTDDTVVRHRVLAAEVAYIEKPFSPDSLGRKVREVLDRGMVDEGRAGAGEGEEPG